MATYTYSRGRWRDSAGKYVSAAAVRRSEAARRGWETRRANAVAAQAARARRSEAARRGWETRRANAVAAQAARARRSEAARRGWETRRRKWTKPTVTEASALSPARREAVAAMVAALDVRDPWERHLARDVPPVVYVHEQALARMVALGYDPRNRDVTWRRAWGQVYRDQAIKYYATLTGLKIWQVKGLLKLGDLDWATINDALHVVSPKRKKR